METVKALLGAIGMVLLVVVFMVVSAFLWIIGDTICRLVVAATAYLVVRVLGL